jgi:diadenosine tetraphosphate (Ap4A) HIT family hydrolase
MERTAGCPFCSLAPEREILLENDLALAIRDGYPVCVGHTLVIPRRHESDFLALRSEEMHAMFDLAVQITSQLKEDAEVEGCNIGVNIGEAAGQTIPHAHLHVIPRRQGDVADPRGGIRWVIPGQANYWD